MSEEEKVMEYVNEVEVVLTAIDVETNQNNANEVRRIKFVSNKGDITFKPKTEKEEFKDGMKFKSIVPVTVDNIPEEIKAVAKGIQEKGSVKMLVSYTLMKTTMDNEPKEYRFITSMKTFNTWKVVSETAPVQ